MLFVLEAGSLKKGKQMTRFRIKYNNVNNLYYFQIRHFLWWRNVYDPVMFTNISSANRAQCKNKARDWIELNEWS